MTTDTTPTSVPAPRAHPDDGARPLLASYPHVAACPACLGYAGDHLAGLSALDVLIAVLAHHDSGHRFDLIHGPGRHFAPVI